MARDEFAKGRDEKAIFEISLEERGEEEEEEERRISYAVHRVGAASFTRDRKSVV